MQEINPATIELPPTQPIDMTALMDQIRLDSKIERPKLSVSYSQRLRAPVCPRKPIGLREAITTQSVARRTTRSKAVYMSTSPLGTDPVPGLTAFKI